MRMSLLADALRADLHEVVDLGGESVAEAAERISPVIVRSATTRALDLLSEAAAQVSAELPDGYVELRLAGDDVSFSYVTEAPRTTAEGEANARITLRMPEELKARVEAQAGAEGLSVNAWILRQLERRASRPPGGSPGQSPVHGSRLHGYGTS